MRLTSVLCGVGVCLALAGSQAWAAEPEVIAGLPRFQPYYPGCPVPPPSCPPSQPQTLPQQPQPPQPPAPATDAFAQAPAAGTDVPSSYNPQMLGDFLGYSALLRVRLATPTVIAGVSTRTAVIHAPLASRAAFKIADNESPMPQDRIFFNYNFFSNVNGSLNAAGVPTMNVHREIFGFEKSFLDGDVSVGLRLPLFQRDGSGAFSQADFGDLTVVGKYAWIRNPDTGSVLSGGLAVTAPTGPNVTLVDGTTLDSTIFQPFIGYIWNGDNFYIHGFTAVAVPTDNKDVTLLFNDIGIGYWLYRNDDGYGLQGLVPTFETHINNPLNHRGATQSPIGASDLIVLTAGLHAIWNRASVTFGAAAPVTGPKPFDVEAIAQFNIRF